MTHPDPVDETFASLREARGQPRIDDMHSARLWQAIDARLHEERRPQRRRWWLPAAAVATLALGLGVWHFMRPLPRPLPPPRLAAEPRAPTSPAHGRSLDAIVPYLVAGSAPSRLLDGNHRRVVLPAGGLLRAAVGVGARISLLGPAELSVLTATDGELVLDLRQGILLCDYQNREGIRLRIRSPAAETRVVGTLFSVEATASGSSVAVARGAVEVVTRTQTVRVPEGRRLPAEGQALAALDRPTKERLARHEGALLPPEGETGVLSVSSESDVPLWLGARLLGTPPLSVRLPAGPVTLQVATARPGAQGEAPLRHIETLILPDQTAVAIIDSAGPAAMQAEAQVRRPKRVGEAGAVARLDPVSGTAMTPVQKEDAPAAAEAPAPPAAAQTPAPVEEETPGGLYRRAEAAMGRGDKALAQYLLRSLVRRFPAGETADSARYELARTAFATGDLHVAGQELEALREAALSPALAEPVAYLRCRIEVARADRERAATCLAEFRRSFPRSAHGAEVLALLAALRFDKSCASALPLLDEYLQRYPRGPFAQEARERRQRCGASEPR